MHGVVYVDECSVSNFVTQFVEDKKYLQMVKISQKYLADILGKADVHAAYYSAILKTYNSYYNGGEDIKKD
jgi:hypothetical protein